jgi:DNA-binding transcriptional MerR regulator
MRIAELSRKAGVPVPTIKFYLREGLLPPGRLTSPNQATYGEEHLRRLRLIRAMVDVAHVPIATIRGVLKELDQPVVDLHHVLGSALSTTLAPRNDAPEETRKRVADLIARRGWCVSPDSPAAQTLAEVLAAFTELGVGDLADRLDEFAAAAERIAAIDLAAVGRRRAPEDVAYAAVIGTIVGDRFHLALRRLAHENASAAMFAVRAAAFACGEETPS